MAYEEKTNVKKELYSNFFKETSLKPEYFTNNVLNQKGINYIKSLENKPDRTEIESKLFFLHSTAGINDIKNLNPLIFTDIKVSRSNVEQSLGYTFKSDAEFQKFSVLFITSNSSGLSLEQSQNISNKLANFFNENGIEKEQVKSFYGSNETKVLTQVFLAMDVYINKGDIKSAKKVQENYNNGNIKNSSDLKNITGSEVWNIINKKMAEIQAAHLYLFDRMSFYNRNSGVQKDETVYLLNQIRDLHQKIGLNLDYLEKKLHENEKEKGEKENEEGEN